MRKRREGKRDEGRSLPYTCNLYKLTVIVTPMSSYATHKEETAPVTEMSTMKSSKGGRGKRGRRGRRGKRGKREIRKKQIPFNWAPQSSLLPPHKQTLSCFIVTYSLKVVELRVPLLRIFVATPRCSSKRHPPNS